MFAQKLHSPHDGPSLPFPPAPLSIPLPAISPSLPPPSYQTHPQSPSATSDLWPPPPSTRRVLLLLVATNCCTFLFTLLPVLVELPVISPPRWYVGNDVVRLLE